MIKPLSWDSKQSLSENLLEAQRFTRDCLEEQEKYLNLNTRGQSDALRLIEINQMFILGTLAVLVKDKE